MNSCILHPTNKENKPSKLFSDLRREFSYNDSWDIWDLAVSPEFQTRFQGVLDFDEFGEPTIDSVLLHVNVDNDNSKLAKVYERRLNANLPKDNQALLDYVVEFNRNHHSVKAQITSFNATDSDEIQAGVQVVSATPEIAAQVENLVKNAALFSKVNAFLKNLGMTAEFVSASNFNGEEALMDPQSGLILTNGLRTVIKLSNNEHSLEQLPEELGHFLIECNKDNPNVKRVKAALEKNPELVQEILGNEYDSVLQYYINQGNPDNVIWESMGRLLIRSINNEFDNLDRYSKSISSLKERLQNIWKAIKNLFKRNNTNEVTLDDLENSLKPLLHTFEVSKATQEKIISDFNQSNRRLAHINTLFREYDDIFKKGGILDSIRKTIAEEEAQYATTFNNVKKLRNEYNIAKKAFELFSQPRQESLNNEPEEFKSNEELNELSNFYSPKEIIDVRNLYQIGNYLEKIIENIKHQEKLLFELKVVDNLSYESLLSHSKELMTIKSFIEVHENIINDIVDLTNAIRESGGDTQLTKLAPIANALYDIANNCRQAIDHLNSSFHSATELVTDTFWENASNAEDISQLLPDYVKNSLELDSNAKIINHILSCSMQDINGVLRIFSAYYDQRNPIINLANNVIRRKEEEARKATLNFAHKLRDLVDDYVKKTGSRDFTFIYEIDEKGKPTGFLKNKYNVDIAKYLKTINEEIKKINSDKSISEELRKEKIKGLRSNFLQEININNYKFNSENCEMEKIGSFILRIPTSNSSKSSLVSQWKTNSYNNLTKTQREFLDNYVELKNSLDSVYNVTDRLKSCGYYFRAPQRVVGSITEAVINNDNLSLKLLGKIVADDVYRINTNDDDFIVSENETTAAIGNGKLWDRLKYKIKKTLYSESPEQDMSMGKKTKKLRKNYKQVPSYFTKLLNEDDLSKLSTDANGSLMEYAYACFRFNAMNEIADIMELTYERARWGKVKKNNINELFGSWIDDESKKIKSDVYESAETSNFLKSLRSLLDTHLYNERNAEKVKDGVSPTKITNFLLKATSFTMLGYNVFSGINNKVVGKYQTMIEAIAGSNFNIKDWAWAEIEYKKLAPEYFKDLASDKKTSKLYLLNEMFNATMEWKDELEGSKFYNNAFLKSISQFDSSVLMNIGETNLKMVTMLAMLKHYKMLDKNGKETTLYDALEVSSDNKIVIKNGYTKPDGSAFTLTSKSLFEKNDLDRFCLRQNAMNHKMHGIYNYEDSVEAKRYWWGKLILLFRNFIAPTVAKRYATSHYNIESGEVEEGFYVTLLKFIGMVVFKNENSYTNESRIKASLNNLTDAQKVNLRRAITEFCSLALLGLLIGFVLGDWDDDDDYTTRSVNYFARRLQQEIRFYQPWHFDSVLDILHSPSATLGMLSRYKRIFKSMHDVHVLESGPYKGELNVWANTKRALPIYPVIHDVVNFAEDDSRFEIFESY